MQTQVMTGFFQEYLWSNYKKWGVNSHMAIRCQELNIPAAIGIGEANFKLIEQSNELNLNCKFNKINVLN